MAVIAKSLSDEDIGTTSPPGSTRDQGVGRPSRKSPTTNPVALREAFT